MNRVIGVANEQIPLLQRTTAEATERARDAERERDALRLEVQDLQSKLALAGTETTANRLRDVELELKNTKEALVNKTHELTQQRLKAAESRKQQHLVAIDLTNYRKYIQKAREREKSYREDILTLTKRLHALGCCLAPPPPPPPPTPPPPPPPPSTSPYIPPSMPPPRRAAGG